MGAINVTERWRWHARKPADAKRSGSHYMSCEMFGDFSIDRFAETVFDGMRGIACRQRKHRRTMRRYIWFISAMTSAIFKLCETHGIVSKVLPPCCA